MKVHLHNHKAETDTYIVRLDSHNGTFWAKIIINDEVELVVFTKDKEEAKQQLIQLQEAIESVIIEAEREKN